MSNETGYGTPEHDDGEPRAAPKNGGSQPMLFPFARGAGTGDATKGEEQIGDKVRLPANQGEQSKVDLAAFGEQLTALGDEVKQLAIEKQVFTQMQNQLQELREQFHEREVLYPVFLSLIGIADRCRQETARLRRVFNGVGSNGNVEVALAIRSVIEAREADRIEIESLLANYGVEPFKHPDDQLTPSVHKCVGSEHCEDRELHGRIARRHLPGYRRNGHVLRPECVTVYVHKGQDKGGVR